MTVTATAINRQTVGANQQELCNQTSDFTTAAVVDLNAFDVRITAAEAGASSQVKVVVRGASTGNVASLSAFTVANDGITLVATDRVLLKNQSTASQNGIYTVGTVGGGTAALTRATDDDASAEMVSGMVVLVSEGTANLDTAWKLTTNAPITIGSTNLVFAQVPFGYDATAPASISTAAVVGTANAAARRDHVHAAMPLTVRGVATTNVANLAAFVIAGFDGVTYAEGDLVLLANQTTGAQSGIYQVGAVAGTAPLTRVAWLPAAAIVYGGFTVHVSEGTDFGNTNWFISTTGAITIGTTAHVWYPESVTVSQALTSGTAAAITRIPLLSATKSQIVYTRTTVSGTLTNTVSYQTVPAPTPGAAGTASIVPMATVAAGTIQNQDGSTLLVTVINR